MSQGSTERHGVTGHERRGQGAWIVATDKFQFRGADRITSRNPSHVESVQHASARRGESPD